MAQSDVFRRWWADPQAEDGIEISLDGSSARQDQRHLLFSIVNGQASYGPGAPKVLRDGWIQSGEVTLQIAEAWVADEPTGVHEVHLRFTDGSSAVLNRDDKPAAADDRVLDRGEALLEPIGVHEFQGIETIIGRLYAAAGTGRLNDLDERRILELAELIQWQHRQTTPNQSPRWELVGVVRSTLLKLAAEVPVTLVAGEIALKLHEIGWHDLAAALARYLP